MDTPQLNGHDAHVWLVDLDREPADAVRALLSEDESARADRYHFARDTARYVVGRAALRQILALYLRASPRELIFRYGGNGKPALAQGETALRFNLSHS